MDPACNSTFGVVTKYPPIDTPQPILSTSLKGGICSVPLPNILSQALDAPNLGKAGVIIHISIPRVSKAK